VGSSEHCVVSLQIQPKKLSASGPGLVKLWFRKVVKYYLAKTPNLSENHGPLILMDMFHHAFPFGAGRSDFAVIGCNKTLPLQKEMEQKPHRNTLGLDCRHHKVDLTKLYTPKKSCSTTFPPFCWRVKTTES